MVTETAFLYSNAWSLFYANEKLCNIELKGSDSLGLSEGEPGQGTLVWGPHHPMVKAENSPRVMMMLMMVMMMMTMTQAQTHRFRDPNQMQQSRGQPRCEPEGGQRSQRAEVRQATR